MRTSDAVSPIAGSQVFISLIALVGVYAILGLAAFYLMAKFAVKGPDMPSIDAEPVGMKEESNA
jgi:cytochrome d ubiquinol oxidase subunit I